MDTVKNETAGFSEPPVKSCTAEVQKMALGVQILELHTEHYMAFLLQDAVKIPVLNIVRQTDFSGNADSI